MKIFAPLIVFSVAMLVYCNTLFGQFVADDHVLIENNRVLGSGQSPLAFFSQDHYNVGALFSYDCGQYRPVQALSFWLDAAVWGIQPAPFHLTNVVLHALTCLAFYWLGVLWFRSEAVALLSALIFACHPVHTESVALVADRHVIASGFFVCTSLLAFTHAVRGKHPLPWSAACAVLLLLGLLCKETCIVAPLAMMAWMMYTGSAGDRWRAMALWTAVGTSTVVGVYLLLRLGVAHIPWPSYGFVVYPDSRLVTAARAFAGYLQLLIWPLHLSLWRNEALLVPSPFTPLAVLVACLYVGLLLWTIRRAPQESFCLLWILLFLLPPLDRVRAYQPFSERRLYIPCMGFCWLLARGILALRWRTAHILTLCGVILCLLTWRTVHRNLDWGLEENYWKVELQTLPRSQALKASLAEVYLNQNNYRDATAIFNSIRAERPQSCDGYAGLSAILMNQKKPREALAILRQGIARNATPAFVIHYNLALVLLDLGKPQKALGEFAQALQENPQFVAAYYDLGITLAQLHRYSEAAVTLQRALAVNPHEIDVRTVLGKVCTEGGQFYERSGEVKLAVTLYEDYLEYCMNDATLRADVQQRLARLHRTAP